MVDRPLRAEQLEIRHKVLDAIQRAELESQREVGVFLDAELARRLLHFLDVTNAADHEVVALVNKRLRCPEAKT